VESAIKVLNSKIDTLPAEIKQLESFVKASEEVHLLIANREEAVAGEIGPWIDYANAVAKVQIFNEIKALREKRVTSRWNNVE